MCRPKDVVHQANLGHCGERIRFSPHGFKPSFIPCYYWSCFLRVRHYSRPWQVGAVSAVGSVPAPDDEGYDRTFYHESRLGDRAQDLPHERAWRNHQKTAPGKTRENRNCIVSLSCRKTWKQTLNSYRQSRVDIVLYSCNQWKFIENFQKNHGETWLTSGLHESRYAKFCVKN